MTFINVVRSDLRNGVAKRWVPFLFVGILFVTLAFFAYLDFDAAQRMNPSPITTPVTLGDYLLYLFGGTSSGNHPFEFIDENNIVNSLFIFTFPSIWILVFLVLLLLTLQYPYEDLMGFGKTIIILSKKTHYWWMSKCIWVIVSVVLYFSIAFICYSVKAIILGAEPSLNIGTYYPYFRFTSADFITEPPWNIVPTLSMVIPVGIGLCLIQLTTSLITSRLYSYLLSSAFLIASAYMQHEILFPNVSMFARSINAVTNGQYAILELIVIAWFSSMSILAGYIYLDKADIINKHR